MMKSVLLPASAALVSAVLLMAPSSAFAIQAAPYGTPVGAATDTLTVTGVYTGGVGQAPFSASAFTFTATIPQKVALNFSNTAPPGGVFATPGTVSYVDGATAFSQVAPYLQFGNDTNLDGSQAVDPASQFGVTLRGVITQGDAFFFNFDTALSPIYTFSNNGLAATANTGSYAILNGSAGYQGDPPFTGIAMVTTDAVPEPATWALMLIGSAFAGAGLRQRSRRRFQAA